MFELAGKWLIVLFFLVSGVQNLTKARIADWHPAIGVVCLIVFLVAATVIFHRFWQKGDPVQRNMARLNLLSNIAILGGLPLLLESVR